MSIASRRNQAKGREGRTLIAEGGNFHASEPDGTKTESLDINTAGLVRIWDTIDHQWTAPMPRHQVELSLRQVELKCSACRFASSRQDATKSHIENILTQGPKHLDAVAEEKERTVGDSTDYGAVCTGCKRWFKARNDGAQRHINETLLQYERHAEDVIEPDGSVHQVCLAEEVVVHRFATQPESLVPAAAG